MLFRDNEKYKLTENQIKEFKEAVGLEFPMTIKYTKDRVSFDPRNEVEVYPEAIHIRPVGNEITDTGIVTWRYAKNVKTNRKGQKVYEPNVMTLNKTRLFTKRDIEFVWWLWKACPLLKGGMNEGPRPSFEFENVDAENAIRVEVARKRATVEKLIYDELQEEELRDIARAYFLPGADKAGLSTLKVHLINYISRSGKVEDYNRFLEEFDQSNAELETRSIFAKAFDNGFIQYRSSTKTWHWVVDGDLGDVITKMRTKETTVKGLYNQLKNDRTRTVEFVQTVTNLLKGK
jgi:hypothetical protein